MERHYNLKGLTLLVFVAWERYDGKTLQIEGINTTFTTSSRIIKDGKTLQIEGINTKYPII